MFASYLNKREYKIITESANKNWVISILINWANVFSWDCSWRIWRNKHQNVFVSQNRKPSKTSLKWRGLLNQRSQVLFSALIGVIIRVRVFRHFSIQIPYVSQFFDLFSSFTCRDLTVRSNIIKITWIFCLQNNIFQISQL